MLARLPNDQPLKSSADPLRGARRPLSETASAVPNSAGSLILLPSYGKRASGSDLNQSDLPIFNQDW
jgi:hypothetical protein